MADTRKPNLLLEQLNLLALTQAGLLDLIQVLVMVLIVIPYQDIKVKLHVNFRPLPLGRGVLGEIG